MRNQDIVPNTPQLGHDTPSDTQQESDT